MPLLPSKPSASSARTSSPLAAWFESSLAGFAVPAASIPAFVFVGLGDGEALRLVAARCPRAKVLALEPDPAVAARCAAHPLAAEWIKAGRLTYLAGPSYTGSDRAWRVFPDRFETPPVLVHPQLVLTPAVAKATEVLKAILFGAEANARARKRFAPQYLLNSLRNLPGIIAGRDVRDLTGAFAGVPAVIVAAGPSLDRNLPELAACRDRALIIATDTAARPLLSAGVAPHLIVGLDPSEVNGRHLLALPGVEQSWLVAESALDPRATAAFAGRRFWFRVSGHQPWPWFNELGLDVGRLDVWGSVLTGAYNLAVLAGCDPIVLVGADLSFPGRRPYARGTTYEFDWAWGAALGTALDDTWNAAMQRELVEEEGLRGDRVVTTPAMRSFREWLRARAAAGGPRIVNATGDGILIGPGIEQLPLEAVLPGPIAVQDPGALPSTPRDVRPDVVAGHLRAVGTALTNGTDTPLVTAWVHFTLDTLDRGHLALALSGAAGGLDPTARAGDSVSTTAPVLDPGSAPAAVRQALTRMPEAHRRLRHALGYGSADLDMPADTFTSDDAGRAQLMTRALALLRSLLASPAQRGDAAITLPLKQLGSASVGALAAWPEPERWTVLQFEALLGAAVVHDARPDETFPVAARRKGVAWNARLLLACEWIRSARRCSRAGEPGAEANGHGGSPLRRAHALVSAIGSGQLGWSPEGTDTESLVLRLAATDDSTAVNVDVDIPVSREAHARLLAGRIAPEREPSPDTIAPGLTPGAPFATIVVGGPAVRTPRDDRWLDLMPRRLTAGDHAEFVIGSATSEGVVVAATATHESWLVREDGRMQLHHAWPRTLTGVLPLDGGGAVAWSSIFQPAEGLRPYLMSRPAAHAASAQETVVDLPFRAASGCWWNGVLYMACLPQGDTPGGVGCWRPSGEPEFLLGDLPLIGIAERDGQLVLRERPRTVGTRLPVTREWRWTPGTEPVEQRVAAGSAVAHNASTADGRWMAATIPDRDGLVLTSVDGARFVMACARPYRVAWSGVSLLVTTMDRQLLCFDGLREALESLA